MDIARNLNICVEILNIPGTSWGIMSLLINEVQSIPGIYFTLLEDKELYTSKAFHVNTLTFSV